MVLRELIFLMSKALLLLCDQQTHDEYSCEVSTLRCPSHLLLPGGCPELAFLFQVMSLRQLLLPDVATEDGVAMSIHSIGEVLTGHANAGSLPTL